MLFTATIGPGYLLTPDLLKSYCPSKFCGVYEPVNRNGDTDWEEGKGAWRERARRWERMKRMMEDEDGREEEKEECE